MNSLFPDPARGTEVTETNNVTHISEGAQRCTRPQSNTPSLQQESRSAMPRDYEQKVT